MVWCLFKAKSIYKEEEEENLSLLFADWIVGKFVRGHGLVTGHKKTLLFFAFLMTSRTVSRVLCTPPPGTAVRGYVAVYARPYGQWFLVRQGA